MTDLNTATDYTKQAEKFAKKAMAEETGSISIRSGYADLAMMATMLAMLQQMVDLVEIAKAAHYWENIGRKEML